MRLVAWLGVALCVALMALVWVGWAIWLFALIIAFGVALVVALLRLPDA